MVDHQQVIQDLENIAGETAPDTGVWGIFTNLDVNVICGAGSGGFWFFTRLEDYLQMLRHLAWIYPTPDNKFDELKLQDNFRIVDDWIAGKTSKDAMVLRLNELLERLIRLKWLGQVQDLMTEDTEFAIGLRAGFLSLDEDDEKAIQPLDTSQADEFYTFLKEYYE
jgi:hypothetical protein